VALQGEVVLELADHALDELPFARCPSGVSLKQRSWSLKSASASPETWLRGAREVSNSPRIIAGGFSLSGESACLSRIYRADERTQTADLISLRVMIHTLQGYAGGFKCRIFRGVSFLCLAVCCTVSRSRWCQSGVNLILVSALHFVHVQYFTVQAGQVLKQSHHRSARLHRDFRHCVCDVLCSCQRPACGTRIRWVEPITSPSAAALPTSPLRGSPRRVCFQLQHPPLRRHPPVS
jgi:hypothetical protein